MLRAIALSLGQLDDPRVLHVLGLSLAATLVAFIVIGWRLWALLQGFDPCAVVSSYSCAIGEGGGAAVALIVTVASLWLLFPAVAIGVIGLFSDQIVAAVEARHYPAKAATARHVGMGESIMLALGSASRLLLWNLAALPFYILLLFTAIGPFLLFLPINALVLGRDLGEMVMARHVEPAARAEWLAATRGRRAAIGLVATGLFMVPLVNLLAPVLGAAIATHRLIGKE